jgi:hypothetical protein
MKPRLTLILIILAIILTGILSRLMGNSDYILAQTNNLAYKFFYCPYNREPYTNPNYPYQGYPAIRLPYPYQYPLPQLYPCPCTTPPVDLLLQD